MEDTTPPQLRWFRLTPGRFVLLLLAVEVFLWLSERFGWIEWHKGYAELAAVAVVGAAVLFVVGWFGVALIFRLRFQFSLRLLLVLVVIVALPCSWLAVEMRKAGEQKAAVERLRALGAWIWYDHEPEKGNPFAAVEPPGPALLRSLLGDDFFADVAGVSVQDDTDVTDADFEPLRQFARLQELALVSPRITDATFAHIKRLTELRRMLLRSSQVTDGGLKNLTGMACLELLDLSRTKVTSAGVAKLQQALPNCKIVR